MRLLLDTHSFLWHLTNDAEPFREYGISVIW